MITKIEARNYKAFKYISQEVKPFQILIGPNASGKSTFLDIVAFIADIMNVGLQRAVTLRTTNFEELTFNRLGGTIEFALEFSISINGKNEKIDCRYEIRIGELKNKYQILGERILEFPRDVTKKSNSLQLPHLEIFGFSELPDDIESRYFLSNLHNRLTIVKFLKNQFGDMREYLPSDISSNDFAKLGFNFFRSDEVDSSILAIKFASNIIPLNQIIYQQINKSVTKVTLESNALCGASQPGQGLAFLPSGSNLPWLIEDLKFKNAELYQLWLGHIQMALPDVEEINILKMENHNMRYISIKYKDGANISSWMLSDGTLRLLALTFIAYQPETKGMYLIEEPENGVHPKNLSYIYQSLSSVYGAQVFIATHSPLLLSIAGKGDLLLFSKNEDGSISISDAEDNDYLKKWDSSAIGLGSIFASGILS